MEKPSWNELMDAYEALAEMVLGEWPGSLVYSVRIWGNSPENLRSLERVEAWRNAPASAP